MLETFTFDDVLIMPKFSNIESRKDVSLATNSNGFPYTELPIISANMDTITNEELAKAMLINGAQACLHRFQTIEDNVKMFLNSQIHATGNFRIPLVSVGLGKKELERAEALVSSGAYSIIVDVAHGASMAVVSQVRELRKLFSYDVSITVGNFATKESVSQFLEMCNEINGVKVGIGPGSRCLTRIVTGCGYPQLSAVMEIYKVTKQHNLTLIADGGLSNSGDCAKALGAGADFVMSGSLFAGCKETPGEVALKDRFGYMVEKERFLAKKLHPDGTFTYIEDDYSNSFDKFKKYRGSASKESYEVQGKTASHRSPEGDSTFVPYKGHVKDVLQQLEGGLRSAFTYTNSRNLKEFHENVEFVRVSSNTTIENGVRGGNK